MLTDEGEPQSYKEAINDIHKEEWRKVMQEEMQSLHENNTYELVEWRIAMQEEMKSLHENNTYELVEWRRAM